MRTSRSRCASSSAILSCSNCLGLPGTGKLLESRLEDALLDNLQAFLLELGKGFAFVARQQRISTESKDFYLDLVFYNYLLKCFVLFDLTTDELTHQDIGQIDMYVRLYDDQRRGPDDGRHRGHHSVRSDKDHTVVRYSVLHGHEHLFATKYKLVLPTEAELRAELIREQQLLAGQLLVPSEDDETDRQASKAEAENKTRPAMIEGLKPYAGTDAMKRTVRTSEVNIPWLT